MRAIAFTVLGVFMLAGAVLPAGAADCKVKGWTDGGQGGRPIFECPDQN
jgi:hypothetical protein